MHYAYLDISGHINSANRTDDTCVIAVTTCADTRIPQLLLKHEAYQSKEILHYFRKYGEFKFYEMCRGKHRVQKLLEDTLCRIAAEPSLNLTAAIVKETNFVEGATCIMFNATLPATEPIQVFSDQGSLEKFKFFVRMNGINVSPQGKPQSTLFFLEEYATNEELTRQVAEQMKIDQEKITSQIVPIRHVRSHDYSGIQISDLVAGAVFHQAKRNNPKWFDLIKHKVKVTTF